MLKQNLRQVAEEFIVKGEDFTAYDISRTMNDRLVADQEFPIRHSLIRDIVHEVLDVFVKNGELDKQSLMYKGNYCQVYSPICRKVNDGAGNATAMTKDGPKIDLKLPSAHSDKTVIVNKTKYGVNIPALLSRYAGFSIYQPVVVNGNCVLPYVPHQLNSNRSYTVDKHNEVRLTNAALNDMKIKGNKIKLTASKTGYVKVEEV